MQQLACVRQRTIQLLVPDYSYHIKKTGMFATCSPALFHRHYTPSLSTSGQSVLDHVGACALHRLRINIIRLARERVCLRDALLELG